MSCIKLYRGDLCHFHLLSIENIADFVTCSSIRAVCTCARVCVVVGDGGGQIYSKSSRWGWGWGELANVAPLWTNYLNFNRKKKKVTPLIFASKSTFSEHLRASIRSHHPHFKTHGPGF